MKLQKNTFLFIKSTLIVGLTSALVGLGIWIIGGSFLASFILVACVQYILFGFFGNIINTYFTQITRQKELEKIEQLSTILECAYCKTRNIITFIPDENERIEFICDSCTKKNMVNISFTVARMTEPIVMSDSSSSLPNLTNEEYDNNTK